MPLTDPTARHQHSMKGGGRGRAPRMAQGRRPRCLNRVSARAPPQSLPDVALRCGARLVVVDSIAALARAEFGAAPPGDGVVAASGGLSGGILERQQVRGALLAGYAPEAAGQAPPRLDMPRSPCRVRPASHARHPSAAASPGGLLCLPSRRRARPSRRRYRPRPLARQLLGRLAVQLKSLAESLRLPMLVTNQARARRSREGPGCAMRAGGSPGRMAAGQGRQPCGCGGPWPATRRGLAPRGGCAHGGRAGRWAQCVLLAAACGAQVTTRVGGSGPGTLAAALGTKWAHCVNVRLVLERLHERRFLRVGTAGGSCPAHCAARSEGPCTCAQPMAGSTNRPPAPLPCHLTQSTTTDNANT
jgi:hypothetical protein